MDDGDEAVDAPDASAHGEWSEDDDDSVFSSSDDSVLIDEDGAVVGSSREASDDESADAEGASDEAVADGHGEDAPDAGAGADADADAVTCQLCFVPLDLSAPPSRGLELLNCDGHCGLGRLEGREMLRAELRFSCQTVGCDRRLRSRLPPGQSCVFCAA